jgi:hypothetical protein
MVEEKTATRKANATITTGKLERILGKLPAGLSRSVISQMRTVYRGVADCPSLHCKWDGTLYRRVP